MEKAQSQDSLQQAATRGRMKTEAYVLEIFAPRNAAFRLGLCALAALPMAANASPDRAERMELVRRCEDVILQQSVTPLNAFKPAPFGSGAPGKKTYAFYSASQKLLILARKSGKIWDRCTVREAVEGSNSLIDWSRDWPNEFDSTFPSPRYIRLDGRLGPPFSPVALHCADQRAAFVIYPHFGNESAFSVSVSNDPEQAHLHLPEQACQGQ